MNSSESIKQTVRDYIIREFLPGEDPASLSDATPLITGGILDSIATIKLVDFLAGHYGIDFAAFEIGVDHLDNLSLIAEIVQAKVEDGQ